MKSALQIKSFIIIIIIIIVTQLWIPPKPYGAKLLKKAKKEQEYGKLIWAINMIWKKILVRTCLLHSNW